MNSKITCIKDIANIYAGKNLSRGDEVFSEAVVYSQKDLEDDLVCSNTQTILSNKMLGLKDNYITKSSDIIMNLISRTCAIVSPSNENKLIKNSFVKIQLVTTEIDPWYFCYVVNESEIFKKSIIPEVVSLVRPLSVSILGNSKIKLPSLSNQKKLGIMYKNLCRQRFLSHKKEQLLLTAINEIIENV